jgi:hypothetical protein
MPTTITGTNISLASGANTLSMGPTSSVARAWVNFNGTGTVAIRGSSNVSSITDNGVGRYAVNFTSAMADSNYAAISTNNSNEGGAYTYNTTSVDIYSNNASGTGADAALISVIIMR